MKNDAFTLDSVYAAKWTPYGLYIFRYFKDDGEIRESAYGSHVTLEECALRRLADETCAMYGGCDLLESAEAKAQATRDLLDALKNITHAYVRELERGAAPGFDPEKTLIIKQARAAIAKAEGESRVPDWEPDLVPIEGDDPEEVIGVEAEW